MLSGLRDYICFKVLQTNENQPRLSRSSWKNTKSMHDIVFKMLSTECCRFLSTMVSTCGSLNYFTWVCYYGLKEVIIVRSDFQSRNIYIYISVLECKCVVGSVRIVLVYIYCFHLPYVFICRNASFIFT